MEEKPDFIVVGAGPAGAAFAYYASSSGYRVEVYEGSEPGSKPCGWAVPVQIEKYVKVPGDTVLTEIRGFRVYLDGKLVHEHYGSLWGYIIDKRLFITRLLEGSTLYKRYVDISNPYSPRIGSSRLEARERVVLAPGLVGLPRAARETIMAVQQIFRTRDVVEEDVVEIWFDRELVGYYWVFPRSGGVVDIGVGGYEDVDSLRRRLTHFSKKRLGDGAEPLTPVKGARINMSGVDESMLRRSVPVIGEAAGFVYPLTGEGIRPSVASAYALFTGIIRGHDPAGEARGVIRWIAVQHRILEKVKSASPESRARIITSLPTDAFTSLGLGELSVSTLLRLLPKLPRGIASILKAAL